MTVDVSLDGEFLVSYEIDNFIGSAPLPEADCVKRAREMAIKDGYLTKEKAKRASFEVRLGSLEHDGSRG
jgi:hypothetical protein